MNKDEKDYFVFEYEGKPLLIVFLVRGVALKRILEVSEEVFKISKDELLEHLTISVQRDGLPNASLD